MQLDESTDVTYCSQSLGYVRFTENGVVKTELLIDKLLRNVHRRFVGKYFSRFQTRTLFLLE